jgi:hypothetical protein
LFPVGEARTDIKSLLLCTESKSSTWRKFLSG